MAANQGDDMRVDSATVAIASAALLLGSAGNTQEAPTDADLEREVVEAALRLEGRISGPFPCMGEVPGAVSTIPGCTFREPFRWPPGAGPEMVVIPAGRFRMGCVSNDGDCQDWEKPVREVTISAPFALSVHEVTFEEYDRFTDPPGMGLRVARRKAADEGWGRGTRPVINVSWIEAWEYTRWLSSSTGAPYRLPTEAEWEYAARAGTSTKFTWGDEIGVNRANCDSFFCADQWAYTAPVGSFAPNRFGVHDMHGNVWEWILDCWNGNYAGAPKDGRARRGDYALRVRRGGSWDDIPTVVRAAGRSMATTSTRDNATGFRVVRTLAPRTYMEQRP